MRIKEIEILCADLEGTRRFYDALLGLEVFVSQEDRLSFGIGESLLTFRKTTSKKPVYHFAITVPSNQIHEAERWISDKALLIKLNNETIVDFPNWNAKSVYFFDNNGNILEFIARFDLNNASALPFGPSGFLSISEIALVTDDVKTLAKELIDKNGFSYFPKQKQKDDFSVLGDDHGLLILSGSHRNWFPTDIKVGKYPTKILIEHKDELIEIESN